MKRGKKERKDGWIARTLVGPAVAAVVGILIGTFFDVLGTKQWLTRKFRPEVSVAVQCERVPFRKSLRAEFGRFLSPEQSLNLNSLQAWLKDNSKQDLKAEEITFLTGLRSFTADFLFSAVSRCAINVTNVSNHTIDDVNLIPSFAYWLEMSDTMWHRQQPGPGSYVTVGHALLPRDSEKFYLSFERLTNDGALGILAITGDTYEVPFGRPLTQTR
jgi:hypothetical protein